MDIRIENRTEDIVINNRASRASRNGKTFDIKPMGDLLQRMVSLSRERGCRTFCFLSVSPGQGVTTAIVRMSRAIQKWPLGSSVAFIEANAGSPSFHHVFGCARTPGLHDVLSGRCTLDEMWEAHGTKDYFLAPFGSQTKMESIQFKQGEMQNLLSDCKNRFGLTIIDAPPLSASAESLSLARSCDCTFLVLASGAEHAKVAERFIQTLNENKCFVAGAVLNRFRHVIPRWLY